MNVKFNKTGKKTLRAIVGKDEGNTFPIKLSVNYKDLVNNILYKVDYKLTKEANKKFIMIY